ncbi:helix-turn-helix and ligand-binding sensor domain-containing protein [Saccharicrinis aurantiacus]|uniref:helix-turn-helix and ligand-binding sensor domain-containing protein n=1 Tax=Saccharicrinis aurantiacus TaxID=1849719 RepID=UPI00248FB112|nr:triple tyrosine motif-containing protein [Saccharicrinis aurantiacus]
MANGYIFRILKSLITASKLQHIYVYLFITLGIFDLNGQSIQITNFKKDQYNGASKNWSITHGKQNELYFANDYGLLSFDGSNWSLNETPNNSTMRAISINENGRIYSCGFREIGYWEKDVKGELHYTSLTPSIEDQLLENEEFWTILQSDDALYFHSFSNLFRYKDNKFDKINLFGFVNYTTVIDDTVIFSIHGHGIYTINDLKFEPLIESSFFNNKSIVFVISGENKNELIIGTRSHGLFIINKATQNISQWHNPNNDALSKNKINRGFDLKNGDIAIGTILGGLEILSKTGELMYKINTSDGLQSNNVYDISIDNFSNLWIASDKGIDFVSHQSKLAYRKIKNANIGAVYCAALHNKQLYLGTNQGLFYSPWNESKPKFKLLKGTEGGQVWNCKVVGDELVVGHTDSTFVIKDNQIRKISDNTGGNAFTKIPESDYTYIQSTYSDLVLYKKTPIGLEKIGTNKGFYNLINHLEFDHVQNLWASHFYKGIFKINLTSKYDSTTSITHYNPNNTYNSKGGSNYVYKIENRIVFTSHKGLYTYDDIKDSIIAYTSLNENLGIHKNATQIIKAPNNHYWFIGTNGVACFTINGLNVSLIKEFPVELFENQLIPRFKNISALDKNNALVGLENGYAILNTTTIEEGSEILGKKIYLRSFSTYDNQNNIQKLNIDTNYYELAHNNNNISLIYSSPYYSNNTKKYKYKVEGLSNAWSEPQDEPKIELNRLSPRTYTINIKTINGWGKESDINQITIKILPPWYETNYAKFAYLIFILIIIYLIKIISTKQIINKEKQNRLIKEKEIIELRNAKLKGEISFKSQQLANSTLGIIKKNELLLSLKDKIEKQKEQLGTRYPDKYYYDIVKKIEENISGQDDWKIFETNFTQTHESFFKNLMIRFPELTQSDLRLCAYLRINLTSKEIAPMLGITVRAVENHRYRLRKRLSLDSETNLTEFLLSL